MEKFTLKAGIDISKNTLDICYSFMSGSVQYLKVTNDAKGLSSLLKTLLSLEGNEGSILVCCEHTGVYMDKLATVLSGTDICFWPVHPYLIKTFALDLGKIKNDKADAKKILEYADTHSKRAEPYKKAERHIQQLRQLHLLRKQLVKLRQEILNMQRTASQNAVNDLLVEQVYAQTTDHLSNQITKVERQVSKLMVEQQEIKKQQQILTSIPGIGPVISQHILIVTEGFNRLGTYKKLASFIGVAPFERSSGTSVRFRPKTSKKAYQPLKADMHLGAVSQIRKGQLFHDYYHAMVNKGKHHLWIINSIINMLLKIVYVLISKGINFNRCYFLSQKKSWQNLEVS